MESAPLYSFNALVCLSTGREPWESPSLFSPQWEKSKWKQILLILKKGGGSYIDIQIYITLYNILRINIKHLWAKYSDCTWNAENKSGYCFFRKQLELRLKRFEEKMEFVFQNREIWFFLNCADGSGCLFSGAAAVYVGWSWMVSVPTGVHCSCLRRVRLNPKTSCGDPSIPAWEFHGLDCDRACKEVQCELWITL